MTIFLKIVKEILRDKIIAIRDMSLNADSTYLNQALSLVGEGRDLALSAAKRKLLDDTLLVQISGFVDRDDDKTNLDQLQALIRACRKDAKIKSVDKGYDEGASGPAIQKLIDLLQSIFDKLLELHVLGTPSEGDPLHIFYYSLAYYCAQKIAADHDPSFFARIAKNPLVSTSRKFAKDKEGLVMAALDEVDVDIEGLKTDHPHYQQARQKVILTCIDKLRRDNKELCIANAKLLGMFFSPSLGVLEDCMANAVAEISKIKTPNTKSTLTEQSRLKAPPPPSAPPKVVKDEHSAAEDHEAGLALKDSPAVLSNEHSAPGDLEAELALNDSQVGEGDREPLIDNTAASNDDITETGTAPPPVSLPVRPSANFTALTGGAKATPTKQPLTRRQRRQANAPSDEPSLSSNSRPW